MSKSFVISEGAPAPLGFTPMGKGGNFALYSSSAEKVVLGLFEPNSARPVEEIPLNRTGDIWHIGIEELAEGTDYAFRCEGPYDPAKGLLFKADQWLSDPYAKMPDTPAEWGTPCSEGMQTHARSKAAPLPSFDWQDTTQPKIKPEDLVIYEMHVRGFTKHPSSQTKAPGTFLGVVEKIPYLKKLGITAVSLLPIFEFDETHTKNVDPKTGKHLPDYWGYNPLHYFAPMKRYAKECPILEFKTMVRELHKNGIEVILDVVYNHTGEGKKDDSYTSFRGIDNPAYYMVDETGGYCNFTGCGNTFNTNHPAAAQLIVDSLRYWAEEMQVDGFRFDLASIFTRDQKGHPMADPPVLAAIAKDPIVSKVKLIAEAWDAAGLYQVGSFPKWGPWMEWNGPYRDHLRRFIKGTDGETGSFANVITGSEMIYGYLKSPLHSVNFITAHDGYSLRDLVSYQGKHNLANGEMNRDGLSENDSWNCGAEGPTNHRAIQNLRERQMRNFLLALFLSQGIPMMLMGDEYGHTRHGNNNPFVQDNEINWFLWDELEKHKQMFSFVSELINFRKKMATLRHVRFLGPQDIEWHGTEPNKPNWERSSRFVAFTLKGETALYAAFNADFRHVTIKLPEDKKWTLLVNTSLGWDQHHLANWEKSSDILNEIELPPHSAFLAIAL